MTILDDSDFDIARDYYRETGGSNTSVFVDECLQNGNYYFKDYEKNN